MAGHEPIWNACPAKRASFHQHHHGLSTETDSATPARVHEVIENAVGAIRNAIGSAAEVADDEGLLGGLGLALGEIDGWPTKLQQATAERVLEGLADAGVSDTSDEQLDPGASILSGARALANSSSPKRCCGSRAT